MIDISSAGMRCRAAREIRNSSETVQLSTKGTIQYEIEKNDRHFINVHWDNGLSLNVSPSEIEIIDEDLLWQ